MVVVSILTWQNQMTYEVSSDPDTIGLWTTGSEWY